MPPTSMFHRRSLLAAALLPLSLLGGCAHPLPPAQPPRGSDAGRQRLLDSAVAHGLADYGRIGDINIAYDGQWRPLIDRIQPVVVDKGYRGSSQERILTASGRIGQAYRGPAGRKQVAWQRGGPGVPGQVGVWFDGSAATDPAVQQAAAVVAECYGLFLLGPLWLQSRGLPCELAGTERVEGRLCDVVQAWLSPGLGLSAQDRVELCVDRADSVTRRVRFTLEGFAATQGAVAITDTYEHRRLHGVLWPMRSYEEVVHPIRVPAHDWHVTGLDVNRGYGAEAISGPGFTGLAAAPAAPV